MTRTTNWQSLHNDEAKFATKPLFEAAVTQWEIFAFSNNINFPQSGPAFQECTE